MRFYRYLDKLNYVVLWIFNILSNIYFFIRIDKRKMIKKNHELKKRNDTCYIICNGPSLNKTDIMKIQDADTITVNFFYKGDKYKEFESDFHIAIDDAFYSDDNLIYLNEILKTKKTTKLVIKQRALHLFEGNKRVYGTYAKQIQYGDKVCFNLLKNMTAPINVSIMAVQLALSLEYKKIYLLGVDFSEFVLKNGKTEHFYSEDDHEDEVLRKGDELRWFSIAYAHHYALYAYAKKHGVEIYNATPDTYLDAYPYANYDEIINTRRNKV